MGSKDSDLLLAHNPSSLRLLETLLASLEEGNGGDNRVVIDDLDSVSGGAQTSSSMASVVIPKLLLNKLVEPIDMDQESHGTDLPAES